jgi:hypothetical protein
MISVRKAVDGIERGVEINILTREIKAQSQVIIFN